MSVCVCGNSVSGCTPVYSIPPCTVCVYVEVCMCEYVLCCVCVAGRIASYRKQYRTGVAGGGGMAS